MLGSIRFIVRQGPFSPDERQVLTAENDGRVRIWDATTGSLTGQLQGQGVRGALTLSYSPDHRRILVGYDNEVVRVFDTETRLLLHELHTPAESHRVAVFSPDGDRILTAGVNNSTVWNAASGEPKFTLTTRGVTVQFAAFSPSGDKILTVSHDRKARIWNGQSGQKIAELPSEVWHAVFSPDGQRILTAGEDGTARLWDGEGRELDRLAGHSRPVLFADFSPDGRYIVTTSADRTARLWDVRARAAVRGIGQIPGLESSQVLGHVLLGHTDKIQKAVFSSDSERVATISDDLSVRVWEVETGTHIAVLKGHQALISSAVFSRNGQMVLTASEDNTARVWIIEPNPDFTLLEGPDEVLFAAFSADGKRLVTSYEDGTVRLWNGETGASIRQLDEHKEAVVSAVFRRDAREMVTASEDGTARIWNLESDTKPIVLKPVANPMAVNSAVYSPDARFVLTASKSGLVTVWRGSERVRDFKLDSAEVFSATFSPDGTCIIAPSANGATGVWNVESGELLALLKGRAGPCRTAVFSPDHRHVLTACGTTVQLWDSATYLLLKEVDLGASTLGAIFHTDGESVLIVTQRKPFVYRWDLADKKPVELSGAAAGSPDDGAHTGQVTRMALSDRGRRIVTASNDGTARVWDMPTGAPIDVLRHSTKAVHVCGISADGRRIVTTSRDGTARLWHVFASTQELVDAAKVDLPRCLKAEQRQRFGLASAFPPWCVALSKWPPPE